MNNDINNQDKNIDDLSDILTKVEDRAHCNDEPNKNYRESNSANKSENEIEIATKESIEPQADIQKKIPKDNNKKIKNKSFTGSFTFLIISLIFLGISAFYFNHFVINANQIPVKKITNDNDEQTITNVKLVTIYSVDDSLTKLITSDVEVTSENFSLEVKAIFENIKNKNSYNVTNDDEKPWKFMDSNVTLLNSYLVGDNLYLDISSNLIKNIHSKNQELLILYSLINTYTALDGVNHVKILINNKEVDKLKWYSLKTFYSENHDL